MDSAQPPSEGDELKKLEEELKGMGSSSQETQTTTDTPAIGSMPVPSAVPTQETPTTIPPSTETPKGGKIMMMAVGFLVLSLVGVGAYLLGNRNSGQKACTMEAKICADGSSVGRTGPSCEFAPCPVATPDPTANWEIYVGKTFSFKYPTDVVVNIDGDAVIVNKSGASQIEGTELSDGIGLSFKIINVGSLNLSQWIDEKIKEETTVGKSGFVEAKVIEPKTSLIINNYNGYTYTSKGILVGENIFKDIFLQSQTGKVIEISDATIDPGNKGFKEIVGQILSTFKFTDPSDYVCPTGEDPNCGSYLPNAGVRLECTPEFQAWALKNCPTYRTGAVSSPSASPSTRPSTSPSATPVY